MKDPADEAEEEPAEGVAAEMKRTVGAIYVAKWRMPHLASAGAARQRFARDVQAAAAVIEP